MYKGIYRQSDALIVDVKWKDDETFKILLNKFVQDTPGREASEDTRELYHKLIEI